MKIETKVLPLSLLENNVGQIAGLPKNPRFIKDYRYKQLIKSIQDDPEMLELRELIVYPVEKRFVVIAGNQRKTVLEELGYKKTICKILPVETPVEKLRAFVIKDNISFGMADWDALANEWDEHELTDFGFELPFLDKDMVEQVNKQDEWVGMPEYDDGNKPFQITISFRTEADRDEYAKTVPMRFSKKADGSRVWSTWWPEKEYTDIKSVKIVDHA